MSIHSRAHKTISAIAIITSAVTGTAFLANDALAREKPSKASKAEAAEEKVRVGGDVPVIAWTDPTVTPWAVILCIHGLGLHKESFAPLGKKLASLGVQTYAIDVRGFGAWLKTNSLNRVDFNQTLEDVKVTLQAIRLAHPGLPLIILGESMGGAIALQEAAIHPELVDGLVSCVPSGDRFGQKMTAAKVAINLIRKPNQLIDVGKTMRKQVSEDQQLRKDWSDDPKARLHLTAKELFGFQTFMNQNITRAKLIKKVPTLVVQGAYDRLVKPASTIEIFNNITTYHKDLLLIGNAEHLVFENGQFTDHTIDVLTSWIDRNAGVTEEVEAQNLKDQKVEPDLIEKQQHKEQAANSDQRVAMGHLYLGRGYLLTNNAVQARDELKQVLAMAHGSNLARDADALLLTLPSEVIAPNVGPSTKASIEDLKLISMSGAMANDKASVLLFCAPWVEACHSLKQSVVEVMAPFLSHLNFVEINADQPSNDALLKKFGIHPLPAVLFLNGQNEVVSYILGNDKIALRAGLAKIIDPAWMVESKPGQARDKSRSTGAEAVNGLSGNAANARQAKTKKKN